MAHAATALDLRAADHRRIIILVCVVMAVVNLSFGIVNPIMPFLITGMGGTGRAYGQIFAAYAIMQFICAPIWGDLSDRVGRKPVLLVGLSGVTLTYILFALSTQLWMLYIARALAGILASATMPTAMTYIVDISSEEERSGSMATITAASYIGFMLGPTFGGWLSVYGLTVPFYAAALISSLLVIGMLIFLPESLAPELRSKEKFRLTGPNIGRMWAYVRSPVGSLLLMVLLIGFGIMCFWGIFPLYALERYNYGPQTVGTVYAIISLASAAMQIWLTGILTRRFGNARVIQGAFLTSLAGFLLMLLAERFWTVTLTSGIFVLGNAMLYPIATSMISRFDVPEKGLLMGVTNSFLSLGQIIGPIWAGNVFDVNISFPYLSGAFAMAIGLVTTMIWISRNPLTLTGQKRV